MNRIFFSFLAAASLGCGDKPAENPTNVTLSASPTQSSPVAEAPPPAKPKFRRCVREETDYLYNGSHQQATTELDDKGRLVRYTQIDTRKSGLNSHDIYKYTWTEGGSLKKLEEFDVTNRPGETPSRVSLFSHGSRGEILKEEKTEFGDTITNTFEWKGKFSAAKRESPPQQPWDDPPIYGFIPEDLVARAVDATMPPFVFEGRLTVTSSKWGLLDEIDFDAQGRGVMFHSLLGKFKNTTTYGPYGRLLITSEDGNSTEYKYEGKLGVQIRAIRKGLPDDVATFEYDADGFVKGVRWRKEGRADIVSTYSTCPIGGEQKAPTQGPGHNLHGGGHDAGG